MRRLQFDPQTSSASGSNPEHSLVHARVQTMEASTTEAIVGFLYPPKVPDLPDPPLLRPPAPSNDQSAAEAEAAQLPLGGWTKRSLDVGVAAVALLILLPIMLMVAALVKLTMGGPVIYSQLRVGCGGRQFRCYKFRTMVQNSDEVLRKLLESDPAAAQEWRQARKLRNDPRVTPIGQMLRKSSLDELPQLLNVLRGDMSCVGPRPVPEDELERYGQHATDYKLTRPGLTGLWQTSGRNLRSYDDRIALDCDYVRGWSLSRDVVILLKTVPAVMNFHETT